jgi:hypothetical protein
MSDTSLDNMANKVFEIPETEFDKLASTLEARRLRTSQSAAAIAMLAQLRPRLRLARPARRFTPMRLFCRPFEDMLYNPNTRRKAMGRIPRSALAPIWAEVEERAPDAIARVAEDIKAIAPDDEASADAVGVPFWSATHHALKTLREEMAKEKGGLAKLQDMLGGADVLASLDEIFVALAIARPLTDMRRALPPPPIADINNTALAAIVAGLTDTAAITRDGLTIVVISLMARLASPTMLPQLIERLIDEGAGNRIQAMGAQVGEAIASQSEDRMVDVRTEAVAQSEDPVAVARTLGEEIRALERQAKAAGGAGRGVTRQIDRVRTELGRIARETIVSGAAPRAEAAIDALDAPADSPQAGRARIKAVENQIVSLRLCKQYAGDVGLEGEIDSAIKAIGAKLTQRSTALVDRLTKNDASVSSVDLFCTCRLVELVEGSEKAEQLRLKGMAALGMR